MADLRIPGLGVVALEEEHRMWVAGTKAGEDAAAALVIGERMTALLETEMASPAV